MLRKLDKACWLPVVELGAVVVLVGVLACLGLAVRATIREATANSQTSILMNELRRSIWKLDAAGFNSPEICSRAVEGVLPFASERGWVRHSMEGTEVVDPWGRPMLISVKLSGDTLELMVRSSGRDGLMGNDDDFVETN